MPMFQFLMARISNMILFLVLLGQVLRVSCQHTHSADIVDVNHAISPLQSVVQIFGHAVITSQGDEEVTTLSLSLDSQ